MKDFTQLITLHPLLKDEQRDRITIIISGKQFIVQNRQLIRYPQTLLGNEEKRKEFYDEKHQVYRFQRHPSVFESILYYYLNPGILLRPPQIEPEIFYDELRFWNLNEHLIETFIEDDMVPLDNYRLVPVQPWRRWIWETLTYPTSTHFPFGYIFVGLSMFFTLLSSIPLMSEMIPTVTELTQLRKILNVQQIYLPLYSHTHHTIEIICITMFSLEFSLRIVSAPAMMLIQYDLFNLLDFTVILASASNLIGCHLHNTHRLKNFLLMYYWLLILKSFRIYRLARYLSHLRLLYKAMAMCLNELCTLAITVTFSMILFGTLIYILDNAEPESNTRNILDGFWLAFITLTTLGYGDIYPRSLEARLAAVLCALIGIIVFSLPATIVFVKYTTLLQNRWKEKRSIRTVPVD